MFVVLSEESSLVPNIHVKRLTTACIPNPLLVCGVTCIHMATNTNIMMIIIIIKAKKNQSSKIIRAGQILRTNGFVFIQSAYKAL